MAKETKTQRRKAARRLGLAAALCGALTVSAATRGAAQSGSLLEESRRAFGASQYEHALGVLKTAAQSDSQNAEIYLLMAQSYYEQWKMDDAIASAKRAVQLDPDNSDYHLWLGRSYGRKAEQAGWFSAFSLAKKSRRELEAAVKLDPQNFAAQQDLIDYYCQAPGIVGGGEDKAKAQIERLLQLDAAEGHFARAECFAGHKDWARAQQEYERAIQAKPKRTFLLFEMAGFFAKRNQPERVLEMANAAAGLDPSDLRVEYFRGMGRVLKGAELDEAERSLETYIGKAPRRVEFPSVSEAYEWLGRLQERQGKPEAAAQSYRRAMAADPRNKDAREALKRLGK